MEFGAQLLQFLLAGLTAGSIYALLALGLGLIYRTTSILSIAQEEISMLGARAAVFLTSAESSWTTGESLNVSSGYIMH